MSILFLIKACASLESYLDIRSNPTNIINVCASNLLGMNLGIDIVCEQKQQIGNFLLGNFDCSLL